MHLSGPAAVHRANRRLLQSCRLAGPLSLNGVRISLRHIHFGPGVYERGTRASTHQHQEAQVEYVISGEFAFSAAKQEEILMPGRGLVVLPGHGHAWSCQRAGLMLGMTLDVTGRDAQEFLNAIARETFGRLAVLDGDRLASRANELVAILGSDNSPAWLRERVGFMLGLWLGEALALSWPLTSWAAQECTESREEYLCRRAHEFMAANCVRAIRVDDVALEVGISGRHLNRLYGRIRGESIGAALQRLRLEQARRHLRERPEDLIKTVAYRCGFGSPAYFTACYREAFGCAPAADRHLGTDAAAK